MLIVTVEDEDFADLVQALSTAKEIGKYTKDGKLQTVKANNRLVMVTRNDLPDKIAIKPARNLSEAEQIAKQLLQMEEARGLDVTLNLES